MKIQLLTVLLVSAVLTGCSYFSPTNQKINEIKINDYETHIITDYEENGIKNETIKKIMLNCKDDTPEYPSYYINHLTSNKWTGVINDEEKELTLISEITPGIGNEIQKCYAIFAMNDSLYFAMAKYTNNTPAISVDVSYIIVSQETYDKLLSDYGLNTQLIHEDLKKYR